MRVLWTSNNDLQGDGQAGGGIFSTQRLIAGLTDLGHEIGTAHPDVDRFLPWYMQKVHEGRGFARGVLREWAPDVVVAQDDVYPYVVQEAKREGVPVVYVARDQRYRCPQPAAWTTGCLRRCASCIGAQALIPYPWFRHHVNLSRKMAEEADAQVVPSTYMANDMRAWLPKTDPVVIYPPVDDTHHPSKWKPRDVLYLGKGAYKGADIVLDVAREMEFTHPLIRFRICGNQDFEHEMGFRALINCDVLGFVDQGRAFSTAKVLLAPARWPEPAARNVCEAIHLGVPCIISNRGGVPETMGPGGLSIYPMEHRPSWVGAIETLYDDPHLWGALSVMGKRHAEETMSTEAMSLRMETVLEDVL